MNEATEISQRCVLGRHIHDRHGCRSKSCQCECHKNQRALVVRTREKATDRAKKVVIHEQGCSKKPCVCSDIRAGRAAKKVVSGIFSLVIEALFAKPATMKALPDTIKKDEPGS